MRRGLVFGCYDPLHYGHIRLFRACRRRCDHLTVLVHEDGYIRRYKHREPHCAEDERVADVADIASVDFAAVNHDQPRGQLARQFDVDVVFVSEEDYPSRMGIPDDIEVVHMPRTEGISSTAVR